MHICVVKSTAAVLSAPYSRDERREGLKRKSKSHHFSHTHTHSLRRALTSGAAASSVSGVFECRCRRHLFGFGFRTTQAHTFALNIQSSQVAPERRHDTLHEACTMFANHKITA